MPSQSGEEADDIDEQTVIRRNPSSPAAASHVEAPPLPPPPAEYSSFEQPHQTGERIVIPTTDQEDEEPAPRPVVKAAAPRAEHAAPARKSNTSLVVLVTILGTVVVLGGLGGIWYLLNGQNEPTSNRNTNVNVNTSAPNLNLDGNSNVSNSLANFNFNTNANENVNINANVNANLKTPTPTRTPTPTPTPTPQNQNANVNGNLNIGNTNVATTPQPGATPTPPPAAAPTPRISPSATPTPPQNVNVGVMNSRAISLTKPAYPQSARQVNATGQVQVQISVDEEGNVISARAISGHPLLRSPAENAARQSRFNPVKIADRAVRANGILVYNFINQ
jgi:TonB family protein